MTDRQVKWFLTAAQGRQVYPLFVTRVGTGMRQGELLGLQWGDIDFEKGTLEVKRSLGVGEEGFDPEGTQEQGREANHRAAAVRLAALRDHRSRAQGRAITAPVFCTRTGNYLDKKNVLRSFKNVVGKANAAEKERAAKANTEPDLIPEDIRFHDLRHTHASCLIAAGSFHQGGVPPAGSRVIEITLEGVRPPHAQRRRETRQRRRCAVRLRSVMIGLRFGFSRRWSESKRPGTLWIPGLSVECALLDLNQ